MSAPASPRRPPFLARAATRLRNAAARPWLAGRWLLRRPGARHGLPGPLVVSLTSHPPRFADLGLTLRSLLTQSVAPDRIVLWLGEGARERLPPEVEALAGEVDIRTTRDIGPYTKIIPALRAFPDAFIATADDDTCYRPRWLEELVRAWDGDRRHVLCHRAHRIAFAADGTPGPYGEWVQEVRGPASGRDLLPTGVGGVLFPPGSLAADACDEPTFLALSPRADDLWLWAMACRAGSRISAIGPFRPLMNWRTSRIAALSAGNVDAGANDRQMAALVARFPDLRQRSPGPGADAASTRSGRCT
jgi:hypothetical protein